MKRILVILMLVIPSLVYSQDILKIGNIDCPRWGNTKQGSHDYNQDLLKNRNKPEEGKYYFDASYTLEKLLSMKADDNTIKITNMNTVVTVTGYLVDIKYGKGETCNCGTDDDNFWDVHIELALHPNDTKDKFLVVEITPRIKFELLKLGIDLSRDNIKKLFYNSKNKIMVTMTGFLFCDDRHANASAIDNVGGTAWKLHPAWDIKLATVKK